MCTCVLYKVQEGKFEVIVFEKKVYLALEGSQRVSWEKPFPEEERSFQRRCMCAKWKKERAK